MRTRALLVGALALVLATTAAVPAAAAEDAASTLALAAKAFRAAVARVRPSLVTIETYGGVLDLDKAAGRDRPGSQPRRRPGGRPGGRRRRRGIGGISKPGEGPTTGLVLSADGYIVTSTFNFLREPPIITVVLADGSRHLARLCGRDDTRKLCVLKIDDAPDLPVPAAAPREGLRVGQWALSVGVGYGGDEPALSAGILSATSRISGKAVQTDANLSPANYGGPLLDVEGRVIGICVPMSPRGAATTAGVEWYDSGIGFAVPLDGLKAVLERMKAGEVIRPGRLGVRPDARFAGPGVRVQAVQDGSAAAAAGLEAKDVILEVNGEPVADVTALRRLLGGLAAGDEITLEVKRGDEVLGFKLVLDSGEGGNEDEDDEDGKEKPPAPEPMPGSKGDAG